MLVDASRESNLFALGGTNGLREGDLGELALDGNDPPTGGRRSDVDHENLALGELLNLGLLSAIAGLHAEQPP